MTHASLFSGIGGFDLAAEQVGWTNIFSCENNLFCQKVLRKQFPNTIHYGDIRSTQFIRWRGYIDVLSGGFPCQPFSLAGERKGTADARHLWPEMFRAIKEIQPSWIVGENVPGLFAWNDGMVFEQVQNDLEIAGYETIPFLLPACGAGAPHIRNRVWFIAYSASARQQERKPITGRTIYTQTGGELEFRSERSGNDGSASDSDQPRLEEWQRKQGNDGTQRATTIRGDNEWRGWPTESPVCGRDDGIPNRVDRIKALGNAIVPAVAKNIFTAIINYEKDIL